MLEELIEVLEVFGGECLSGVLHPIQGDVMIHGCHKGERAGSAHEPVALGQQVEVFGRVSLGEAVLM